VAFQDYAAELVGWIPRIDYLLCQKLINRAWKDIREARLWSFLRGEGVLICPQIITAGAVTVTQFSNQVTLNAAATAALGNLNNPFITQRQLRVGLGGGSVYSIIAVDNAATPGVLTLDRLYTEASAVGQPYQIYRCYYTPADQNGAFISDFLMFSVILSPVDGYAIAGPKLRFTKAEIDARDPTRSNQGIPYAVAAYKADANGNPIYELWPHPTSARAFPFIYRKRGVALSATVDLPTTLSPDMLIERGLDYACDWAILNAGRFPELKDVDFRLIKAEASRKFEKMLQDAKRNDDNIMLDNYIPNLEMYLGSSPIDSRFMQSHDFSDLGWWE
jgi:hypothetical protein